MDSIPKSVFIVVAVVGLLAYIASGLITLIVRQQLSPLRRLRGPPSRSFFMGNLIEMHDQENNNLVGRWEDAYGSSFIYHGFIGGCRLMTTDPRAVAHILGNAYDYPKPDFVRDSLATMAAGHDGLLTSEGDQHKRQRKILTPAFSAANIRAVTPIFWDKATELRDIWLRIADDPDNADEKGVSQPPRVDVLAWLGRATLDIIGLAGFGYTFNSLTDDANELALAFSAVFSTARKFRVMTILQVWFPVLRKLRRNQGVMDQTQETIRRIGLSLIEERRAVVMAELAQAKDPSANGHVDKSMLGRDLLSILSHETTSTALTWCLYSLARNPMIQSTLRTQLASLSPRSATLDEDLLRLPYLDWVVRETLRVNAPITNTMRVCSRAQDSIPVSRPFIDRAGVLRDAIEVKRHDIISVPIQAVNKSEAVWGPDAQEFRPERWASPPEAINAVPGLWSNTLTFLNGNPLNGNRACIGYKFALNEIKIFLFVLLRDIEFTVDADLGIEKKVNVVTRPFVKSEPTLGNQMPLRIRRVGATPPAS